MGNVWPGYASGAGILCLEGAAGPPREGWPAALSLLPSGREEASLSLSVGLTDRGLGWGGGQEDHRLWRGGVASPHAWLAGGWADQA